MSKNAPLLHDGNKDLFMALRMSIVSTLFGSPLHVHAEGLRGTGKTTVMRWAKEQLPKIERYPGCPYQCHPTKPHCPEHAGFSALEGPAEEVFMPFVEIGHGVKLGTLLGSIDLERLVGTEKPKPTLLPGAIPTANRGILFIDEVNRLAETSPEVTDVLLGVMGTKPGRVKIEEVGLPPWEIEITSSVWAASNPDEDPGPLGDVRRQLCDRFDLVVQVRRPTDIASIEEILLHGENGSLKDNLEFRDLRQRAQTLASAQVPSSLLRYIANLYIDKNIESLRAVQALAHCAKLHAVVEGREKAGFPDLVAVVPLVLGHRVEPGVLAEIQRDLEAHMSGGDHHQEPSTSEEPSSESAFLTRNNEPPRHQASAEESVAPKGWLGRAFNRYREAARQIPPPYPMNPAQRLGDLPWEDRVRPPDTTQP